jgi:hypothetical protein
VGGGVAACVSSVSVGVSTVCVYVCVCARAQQGDLSCQCGGSRQQGSLVLLGGRSRARRPASACMHAWPHMTCSVPLVAASMTAARKSDRLNVPERCSDTDAPLHLARQAACGCREK